MSGGDPKKNTGGGFRPSNTVPRIGRIGGWSSSGPSSSSSSSGSRPRISGFRDLTSSDSAPAPPSGFGAGGGSSLGRGDDDDDDDDDPPNDEGESWFAGGERSGISVQNPDRQGALPGGNTVRDLLRRAAEAGPAPSLDASSGRSQVFSGGGHTLGSDEVESRYIPDPNAPPEEEQETAIRHITFWRDGFSVEDGPLMRYGEPQNDQILKELNDGRAPPSILNVQTNQPVELRVARRLHEDYIPPRGGSSSSSSAFSGAGQRLGAPTPEFAGPSSSSIASSNNMPGSFPAPSSSGGGSSSSDAESRSSITTRFEVDQSLPTTSVQIRLADGTRMTCRMNLTHTVRDLRNFINASRPENLTRPYTIGTTFPNRTLDDDSQSIEAAGLINSVVVQRWV